MIDAGRFLGAFPCLGTRLRLAPGRFEYLHACSPLGVDTVVLSNCLVTVTFCGAASLISFVVPVNVGCEIEEARAEWRSMHRLACQSQLRLSWKLGPSGL